MFEIQALILYFCIWYTGNFWTLESLETDF